MSNVLIDISLHADTQHRAVDLSSYKFIREILFFCFLVSNVLMDIRWHKHRAVLIMSLHKKLPSPQNLLYLKQSFGEMSGEYCRLLSPDPMRVME